MFKRAVANWNFQNLKTGCLFRINVTENAVKINLIKTNSVRLNQLKYYTYLNFSGNISFSAYCSANTYIKISISIANTVSTITKIYDRTNNFKLTLKNTAKTNYCRPY